MNYLLMQLEGRPQAQPIIRHFPEGNPKTCLKAEPGHSCRFISPGQALALGAAFGDIHPLSPVRRFRNRSSGGDSPALYS